TGHIVLITSPFFGHIVPILDFARRLSAYHHVTYIVSASKLYLLKQRGLIDDSSDSSESKLDIIGLNDGNDHNYEKFSKSKLYYLKSADKSIITHIQPIVEKMHLPLIELLFSTSLTTSRPVATRSIRRPIDVIVSDMFITDLFVLPPVSEALRKGLIAYFFLPNSLVAFVDLADTFIKKVKSGEVGSNYENLMYQTIAPIKGIICNSILEFDKEVLRTLRQRSLPGSNTSILFVAPIISKVTQRTRQSASLTRVKQWLDRQWEVANHSSSVIYVSFGSWTFLQPIQIIEIARALKPYAFIWSLKTKLQSHLSTLFNGDEQHLFLDWIPQRFVLTHPAVRLFVSHGGWNSLLESMINGTPTLVWPLFGDQILNGYRLEHELGMGRWIENSHKRFISSDELGRYLKDMFYRQKEYIRRAQQVKEMFAEASRNSSRHYFEELVHIVDKKIVSAPNKCTEL
ncbi:unnamed protein product, partial [Adineta ricciae]